MAKKIKPFERHLFMCMGPNCAPMGAAPVFAALNKELEAAGLAETVKLSKCECLGLCGMGPHVLVYPETVWYSYVTEKDTAEIVKEHLIHNRIVERLKVYEPEED